MSFLAPLFLAALGAIAIPVLMRFLLTVFIAYPFLCLFNETLSFIRLYACFHSLPWPSLARSSPDFGAGQNGLRNEDLLLL